MWLGAAVEVGALVCPSGNARCGDAQLGPPSWEASSWDELVAIMDTDLERSIAKVQAKHPGAIQRDGAVLTGWSRGAFAAPVLARLHPGRWPFLVLVAGNVPLAAASLRKAGVKAVALLAGELGTELAGERKTAAELEQAGFPVKLFVMRGVAHLYPDDMNSLMSEAFAFVLSHEHDAAH
jgi:pimeloyl-ACP methyl ester carboxylesterase